MVTSTTPIKAESRNLDFYYSNGNKALKGISMPLYEKKITALIGPSGCGKSTFLRCFNRMHDLYPGNKYDGEIIMHPDNTNVLAAGVDPIEVRMRISMVFQKPNPFPKSIYENVAYGLRVRGETNKRVVDDKVEEALKGASLWNEVKNRLQDLAFNLSGGQQQRVAIARALVNDPALILADEPTGALDSRTSLEIMALMQKLNAKGMTIVMVTHEPDIANFANRIITFRDGAVISDVSNRPDDANNKLAALENAVP